jgi:hypothetical protein
MQRIVFAAALLMVVAMFAGCRTGIPASIKTEIDLLDTVVSTAVKESSKIEDPEQRAEKAVRALKRAEPHTANLKQWSEREGTTDGD